MKILDFLFSTLPRGIAAVLFLCMVVINFANVVGRKVFGQAIFWSEEVMLFMLIWAVFLGAIAVTYRNEHLRMNLFSARLRPPLNYFLNGATVILFVAAAGFMIKQSMQVVKLMTITGQVSNAANIPMVVLHLSVLVGFGAMILALVVSIKAQVLGKP